MVDPPRLHNKLGANWVEVTKTVLGGDQKVFEGAGEFETWPATPVIDSRSHSDKTLRAAR
jgi:hypothetical protein